MKRSSEAQADQSSQIQTKVLVVDDDAMLRSLIRVRLKKIGYNVIEATDGYDAVKVFAEAQPDIILMDANMPGMDGFQAIATLREEYPQAHKIPILMVSGLEDDDAVDKAFSAGAEEYITKPICWPLLTHRLRRIVDAMVAEANIIQAKTDAVNANRFKSEFLANMSHELRTPMHAILSFAALGVEKVNSAPLDKLERYFSRIKDSGDRLLNLLNDLLDLSKLEAQAVSIELSDCDLWDAINTVLVEMDGMIKKSGVTIKTHAANIDSMLSMDMDKIIQVVRNILSNSLKFTPPGRAITITTETRHMSGQPDYIELIVDDQGCGIPEDELELVFDKFIQSSKTKTGAGGTGLGLAICKEIVDLHEGGISASNNGDGGARFVVHLPKRVAASKSA